MSVSADDPKLHLAALGGAAALSQAILMGEGSHPLHDPQRWLQHRVANPAPAVPDSIEFSPGNRALFESPTETLARANVLPHAAKVWSARRDFTARALEVDPALGTAGTALARVLTGSEDPRRLAEGDGIATGLAQRLLADVPWHAAGVLKGEDQSEAGYSAASFELARVDAAFDKGLVKGNSAKLAESAWRRLRAGEGLNQADREILGDFVSRFAQAMSWNPSPELDFPENPLARLASVDVDTGQTEIAYLSFQAGPVDNDAIASRLRRVMSHNPTAVLGLMASNIVNYVEEKLTPEHIAAYGRGERGNPAAVAFGTEIDFDDQALMVAFQTAFDDLGQIKGIDSPEDLAGIVGVAWDGRDFDDTLRSMVDGTGMALTVSGLDRIDAEPRMSVSPDDFTEFSDEAEPEITIRQEGMDMILGTKARPADRSQMRGRWPTGVAVDGVEVWGTTKPRPTANVMNDRERYADHNATVYSEEPGVWTTPGNHLVVTVPGGATTDVMKVVNKLGLPHRTVLGANRDGKVAEVIFELGDETSVLDVADRIPGDFDTRVYTDSARQAPEGWVENDEFYATDNFGRTMIYRQARGGPSPYSVPVFTRTAAPEPPPTAASFRPTNADASEGLLADQVKVSGVSRLRSAGGAGVLGAVEVEDPETGAWRKPTHLVVSLLDGMASFDDEATADAFGNPASTFRVRRDNRYTKVEFPAGPDGKYLASAVDVAEARLWVASFGGDVKMGAWS